MRLGTKILLLTLAATIGLSGTVIWLVTRDVTAREIDRARHTIKWAVSGYFESVEERHHRDSRLVTLLVEDPKFFAFFEPLETGNAEEKLFAQRQLTDEIFGQTVQNELSYGGISPAFQGLLNAHGKVLFSISRDNPGLAQSLSSQSWATDDASAHNPPRRYIWLDNALYIAMAVPIHTIKGEDPTHVVFVGYRVDDQWLGKLLYLVREDASRRQESLAVISA